MQAFGAREFSKKLMSILSPAKLFVLAGIVSQVHFTAALPDERKGEIKRYKVDALFRLEGVNKRLTKMCSASEYCELKINEDYSAYVSFFKTGRADIDVRGASSDCCFLYDQFNDGDYGAVIYLESGRSHMKIYKFEFVGERRILSTFGEAYIIVSPVRVDER